MPRLEWDKTGEHLYETGVENCALYPYGSSDYEAGVAWNGITAINESPSGAESNPLYADDIKYLDLQSAEEFGASIEAYTYPEAFAVCDGTAELTDGILIGQQTRKMFGLAYKTIVGNDTDGNDHGHKLHLIYGCKAAPSERGYSTINDSPEAITFSWEVNTTPVSVTGHKATSNIVIDSTKTANKAVINAIEAVLFGANEFSETSTYAVGDVVEHTSKLYKCTTAVTTAGEWVASNWAEITAIETLGPRLPLPDEIKTIALAVSGN